MNQSDSSDDQQPQRSSGSAASEAERADFVVVANRLPVERSEGSDEWRISPGGLVTALEPVLRANDGVWVGWNGGTDEDAENLDPEPFEASGINVVAVPLSPGEHADYYEGMSNATLWPLYHDAVAFPEYHREWFETYRAVNERFARAAAQVAAEGATVWVQDYQLQLVPAMLRKLRPDVVIGFFLHIPFPPAELFQQLPWRREILEGLAGADLVGFQVPKDAANFVRMLRVFLRYETHRDRFTVPGGRVARAGAYPISIDAEAFQELANQPGVVERAARIREEMGGRTIIFGVDRLDYTKGLRQRIRAVGELFAEGRLDSEKIAFLQVATPSRERVEEYKRLRDDIDLLVGRINGDHGGFGHQPITYMHSNFPRDEMAAMYRAADVALVTPLRDGMNLVAKEYVACKSDESGALVLSEFAGAAGELKQAWQVNPYDLNGMKEQIMAAVTAAPSLKRRRMRALRKQVFSHDIRLWADTFLGDLRQMRSEG